MERIPFAEFVLNDIRANGALLMDSFMGGEFIIPTRMQNDDERFESGHYMRFKSRQDKDDWTLYTGWDLLGHKATICRGPDNFRIHLRGKIALALRNEEARLYAERKARIKAKKLERKKKELDAAWWP